jgi:hypothetical protein
MDFGTPEVGVPLTLRRTQRNNLYATLRLDQNVNICLSSCLLKIPTLLCKPENNARV